MVLEWATIVTALLCTKTIEHNFNSSEKSPRTSEHTTNPGENSLNFIDQKFPRLKSFQKLDNRFLHVNINTLGSSLNIGLLFNLEDKITFQTCMVSSDTPSPGELNGH